ncbi:hypothetical protein SNEBB_010986 [Seison nebaliae]|nr:hypothetical protein SNEBB_010986 [Seison nebaliae]
MIINVVNTSEYNECSDSIRRTNVVHNKDSDEYYSDYYQKQIIEAYKKKCNSKVEQFNGTIYSINNKYFLQRQTKNFQFILNETFWTTFKSKWKRFHCRILVADDCGKRNKSFPFKKFTETSNLTNLRIYNELFIIKCFFRFSYTIPFYFEKHFNYLSRKIVMKLENSRRMVRNRTFLNIIINNIDSISAPHFQRSLMRTKKYFENNLNGTFFKNSVVVGSNTRPNMNALFAGLISSTITTIDGSHLKKFDDDAKYFCNDKMKCDNIPFYWKLLPEFYVKVFQEDESQIGMYQYLSRGFNKSIADIYFLSYYFPRFEKRECGSAERFYGNFRKFYEVLEDEARANNGPILPFNYISAFNKLTHDETIKSILIDDILVNHLKYLKDKNILDNSLFIINGDHGSRISNYAQSEFGRIEKRRSMFGIRLPIIMRKTSPKCEMVLRENSDSIISPLDVHNSIIFFINNFIMKDENKSYFRTYEQLYDKMMKLSSNSNFRKKSDKIVISLNARGKCLFTEVVPNIRSCYNLSAPDNTCICNELMSVTNSKNSLNVEFYEAYFNRLKRVIVNFLNDQLPIFLREYCRSFHDIYIINKKVISVEDLQNGNIVFGKFTIIVRIPKSKALFQLDGYLDIIQKISNRKHSDRYNILLNVNGKLTSSYIINNLERVDRYSLTSSCILNDEFKKICICN